MAVNYDTDATRILLIGKTGQGKSATGNSIVGSYVFKESDAAISQTKTCHWSKPHKVFGRVVEVVDSPGFFDTELDNTLIHKELIKSLVLTTPGFHAIAYVLKHGERITKEHKETQALFFEWFGPGVEHYTFVILTHCKTETAKNKYLENTPQQQLTELIDKCGRRVVHIDNSGSGSSLENQVQCIFKTVDDIRASNGNHFTNLPYLLAEAYFRNIGPRKLTKTSIRILENAGLKMVLSTVQSAVLKTVQENGNKNVLNTHSSSSGDTDEESDVYSHSAEHENEELYVSSIIPEDSLKEENEVVFGSCMESSYELASDDYQETDTKNRYESKHKIKNQEGRRTMPSLQEEQSDDSTRKGKKVNKERVPSTPPKRDPINEYKEEINNDNGYEKLERLIEHIKSLLNFCKRKIGECSVS